VIIAEPEYFNYNFPIIIYNIIYITMSTITYGETTNVKGQPKPINVKCGLNSYISQINFDNKTGKLQVLCKKARATNFHYPKTTSIIKSNTGFGGFGVVKSSNSETSFDSLYMYDSNGKVVSNNFGKVESPPPENIYRCANPNEKIINSMVYYNRPIKGHINKIRGLHLECNVPLDCVMSEMKPTGSCNYGKRRYTSRVIQKPRYGGIACPRSSVFKLDPTCETPKIIQEIRMMVNKREKFDPDIPEIEFIDDLAEDIYTIKDVPLDEIDEETGYESSQGEYSDMAESDGILQQYSTPIMITICVVVSFLFIMIVLYFAGAFS